MNVENFIKEQALQLKNSRRNIELAPEIDERHFELIKRKYKDKVSENFEKYVLVMSYTETGWFYMTGDTFCFDNFMQGGFKSVLFKDIQSVTIEPGKLFSSDKLFLKTNSTNYELDGCIDGLNLDVLKTVFLHIISKSKSDESDFTTSEQGILSSQLPEELKL